MKLRPCAVLAVLAAVATAAACGRTWIEDLEDDDASPGPSVFDAARDVARDVSRDNPRDVSVEPPADASLDVALDVPPSPPVDAGPCPPILGPPRAPTERHRLPQSPTSLNVISDLAPTPSGLVFTYYSGGYRGGSCSSVFFLASGSGSHVALGSGGCFSSAVAGGKWAWIDNRSAGRLEASDLTAPPSTPPIDLGSGSLSGLAAGPNGLVFGSADRRSLSFRASPSAPPTLIASFGSGEVPSAFELALDATDAYGLSFLSASETRLLRIPLVPGMVTRLATLAAIPSGLAVGGGFAYFETVSNSNYELNAVDVATSMRSIVTSMPAGSNGISAIAADQDFVYWGETSPPRIMKRRHCGGASAVVSEPTYADALAVDDRALYWARDVAIFELQKP